METVYQGIDYGMKQSNIDVSSGIRYGVISQNECLDFWAETSEAYYGSPHCPYCGGELKKDKEYQRCPHCRKSLVDESLYGDDPISYYIDDETYTAESDDYGDIFICKSPYITYAQYCSPCAPGACYLMNELSEKCLNNRAYCFGHDCFDNNKAPYRVYSVKTGKEIEA
jgi:hypothetical protein